MKLQQVFRLFDEHNAAVIFEAIALVTKEKSVLHHDEKARAVWAKITRDMEKAAQEVRRYKL